MAVERSIAGKARNDEQSCLDWMVEIAVLAAAKLAVELAAIVVEAAKLVVELVAIVVESAILVGGKAALVVAAGTFVSAVGPEFASVVASWPVEKRVENWIGSVFESIAVSSCCCAKMAAPFVFLVETDLAALRFFVLAAVAVWPVEIRVENPIGCELESIVAGSVGFSLPMTWIVVVVAPSFLEVAPTFLVAQSFLAVAPTFSEVATSVFAQAEFALSIVVSRAASRKYLGVYLTAERPSCLAMMVEIVL